MPHPKDLPNQVEEDTDAAAGERPADFPPDEDEPWLSSLPPGVVDDGWKGKRTEHPLQQAAMDLMTKVIRFAGDGEPFGETTLISGLMDLVGGIAQATCDDLPSGLVQTQLKRALRGIAFASGAVYPLLRDDVIPKATGEAWLEELTNIESQIYEMLVRDGA